MAGAALVVLWVLLALGARGALSGRMRFFAGRVGPPPSGQMQALQGERLSLLQQSLAHGMIVLLAGLGVLALRRYRPRLRGSASSPVS